MTKPEYLILNVHIVVRPADLEKFWKGLEISASRVIEEKECTLFEISYLENKEKDQVDIYLYEAWTCTVEWFNEVQMNKPYYKPYLEATEKLWKRPREMTISKRFPGKTHLKQTHFVKE
ncbi:hypothetical protein CYLTODRAFT_492787 [Cylindrobasidium torrendii FP15055 ss-10]|uniref:ABM domain-containing protein n=1 Tax=Cylindrobasidium torrendii FP15055 ss-10 TaxID=1314674 RepID=A0A0D7B2Y9_9AGAR|nr:hypothetical protein CYLTODRAFT_492787 [Cylindrobasidium torrendii FP15055 ss-10]